MVTSLKGEANFCEILNWQFCLEMNEGLYFFSGEIFFAPIIWDSFDRIIPLEKAGQGGQMIEDLSTEALGLDKVELSIDNIRRLYINLYL